MTSELRFDARIVCWITWCAAEGCGRVIRNEDGKPLRFHCVEHQNFFEFASFFVEAPFVQFERLAWLRFRRRGGWPVAEASA